MKQAGLSLIELLVVILILGILSTLVLLAFGPAIGRNRTTAGCANNMRSIVSAENLYITDHDDKAPPKGYFDNGMSHYLSASIFELNCPGAPVEHFGTKSTKLIMYDDMIFLHNELYSKQPGFGDKVVRGYLAPEFDIHRDTLLRCHVHKYGLDEFGVHAGFEQPNIVKKGRVQQA